MFNGVKAAFECIPDHTFIIRDLESAMRNLFEQFKKSSQIADEQSVMSQISCQSEIYSNTGLGFHTRCALWRWYVCMAWSMEGGGGSVNQTRMSHHVVYKYSHHANVDPSVLPPSVGVC